MVITKDAVERFSHPSHRFRVQAGFLWSHCQFCAHIIQHAELHSKLERQCHLPDFYIPSPLSQSLDCSEERSCSSLPKHRSVKSFLCSTYHFYKPESRPGSVCQRRRSPYHSRRVARATLAAADCRQEPSHLLPVLCFQSYIHFHNLGLRLPSLFFFSLPRFCRSPTTALQTLEEFDYT